MKKTLITFALLTLLLAMALPAAAQNGYAAIWNGGTAPTGCVPFTKGLDVTNGREYICKQGVWSGASWTVTFQGTTATSITDTNFNKLTGPALKVPAGLANQLGARITIVYKGVYTTAAASLLNVEINLCQVLGCASGTTVAPAGCVVTSTNQANVLANGQWEATCDLVVSAIGSSGTAMAKSKANFNLGAATSAVSSEFQDTATAVSAAVDFTVDEFVHPHFKFASSNAGNGATLQSMAITVQ
jgi:hypothetical protein